MSTHDSYVMDWLKQLVLTSVDAHLHNLDWDAITDSIDWSDIEIDYSSLVGEIDECQLADNVAEDIDWSDVVAEKFEEYMNDHFSRDDIMDKLGTDVSDMMETAIHEHMSVANRLQRKEAEELEGRVDEAIKFNRDYQESLSKRLEALENRKPWWRFW
jgi:hypothetical protein